MIQLFLVLLLSLSAVAQYNGLKPDLVQAYASNQFNCSPSSNVCVPEAVTSGNLEVVYVHAADSAGNVYTINSTLGGVWSHTTPSFDSVNGYNNLTYYRCAPSTGSETISWTSIPVNFVAIFGEFKNISCTVDVSGSTIQTGNVSSVSVGLTTTKNGSLIVAGGSVTGGNEGAFPHGTATYTEQFGADESGSLLTFTQTGLAGSYTVAHNEQNNEIFAPPVTATPMTMQAVAFAPSGIAVTSTLFPNCDKVIPYKVSLAAVGGSGSYTYSLNSGALPAGLSLSGAGDITGTCTTNGTATFTIHVTDGTVSANSGSLTITTDATNYSTPRILQASNAANTAALGSPTQAGNTGLLIVQGFDSDGNHGWVNASSGSTNFLTDNQGNVYTRACPVLASTNAPLIVYATKFTGTIPPVISWPKTSSGSTITQLFMEITGTQNILDCAGFSYVSRQASSPYTLTASYITPVNSELLLPITGIGFVFNGVWAMSFSAGFNSGPSAQPTQWAGVATGTQVATTAGSYSVTTTVSSGVAVADSGGTLLLGLRPGLLLSPSATIGEKPRRPIS